MSHTAIVPPTLLSPGRSRPSAGGTRPEPSAPAYGPPEQQRVREMLTYLAVALPRFSSPAAQLLALQCALRADTRGRVRLPGGFLRGMRLYGRAELWHELQHADWLHCPARKPSFMEAQLLDESVLDQEPGRAARIRAAQWALRPVPFTVPPAMPPAVQLTALVLAAHTTLHAGNAELGVLTPLCGQSPQQLEDLLDRLIRSCLLTSWHHHRDSGEVSWQLPGPGAPAVRHDPAASVP